MGCWVDPGDCSSCVQSAACWEFSGSYRNGKKSTNTPLLRSLEVSRNQNCCGNLCLNFSYQIYRFKQRLFTSKLFISKSIIVGFHWFGGWITYFRTCCALLGLNLPFKYDVVKLKAHWRWGRQFICQGDGYLNLLSISCLTVQHSLLSTRYHIAAQGSMTFVKEDKNDYIYQTFYK